MLLNCSVGEDSCKSWTARRSNQSILKEISPEYSLEGLMSNLKFQYLMWRTDSFEKTLMLGKIEGRRRRGWQSVNWYQRMSSQYGWHHRLHGHEFKEALGVGEWTGKPGALQSMGSQRVVHDCLTELNWIFLCLACRTTGFPMKFEFHIKNDIFGINMLHFRKQILFLL